MSDTRSALAVTAATLAIGGGVLLLAFHAKAPAGRKDLALAMADVDRVRAEQDRKAHAVIAAFQRRVLSVVRDQKVRRSTITISVVQDGHKGSYRARFDASKKFNEQVTLEVLEEAQGIHPESARQAKRFANFAFFGGCEAVFTPLPPILLEFQRDRGGRPIVRSPPFRSAVSTSYNFDEQGLVWMRGETTGKSAVRTQFRWQQSGTGAVLVRAAEDTDDAITTYEYDQRTHSFPVMSRAILIEKNADPKAPAHRYEAKVTWDQIET